MKKIITLLFATAIINTIFISCKKDDPAPSIIGRWNATQQIETEYKNNVFNSKDTTIYNANHKLFVDFAANNTGILVETENNVSDTINFTYEISGNQLTIQVDGSTIPNTFSLTNTNLTINQTDQEQIGPDLFRWDTQIFFTRQ